MSRLDSVRLNNEFRRIGPERDRLIKNELATVEAHIQFYESVLTGVEIDLMQGGLHDLERDRVRERLPEERWAEGNAVLTKLDKRSRGLLVRQRDALDNLAKRSGHTLNRSYGGWIFSTESMASFALSIFWVRDQEPIGLAILTQQFLEFRHLAKGLAAGPGVGQWRIVAHPTAEFLLTALAALALPVGLVRLRRVLGDDLAASPPDRFPGNNSRFPVSIADSTWFACVLTEKYEDMTLASLTILGTGFRGSGDLAVVSCTGGLCGPGWALAAQPGYSGLGGRVRAGDRDPGPRVAALADEARWPDRTTSGYSRGCGQADWSGGSIPGVGGGRFSVAGLPVRPRIDRARGAAADCASIARFLILGFEISIWGVCVWLARGNSGAHGLVRGFDPRLRPILPTPRGSSRLRDLRSAG